MDLHWFNCIGFAMLFLALFLNELLGLLLWYDTNFVIAMAAAAYMIAAITLSLWNGSPSTEQPA